MPMGKLEGRWGRGDQERRCYIFWHLGKASVSDDADDVMLPDDPKLLTRCLAFLERVNYNMLYIHINSFITSNV